MKKILAILLVLALCMSSIAILASCGDPKDPAQSSSNPTPDPDPDPHEHTFVEGKCECGETDPDYVPPHTHTFVEGKCECGEEDPNYVPPHTHTFVEGKCECGETDPNYVAPTPDVEDPNGVMLYYQNFDGITGTDNATILEQLGWKDNVNDITAWSGPTKSDAAGAELAPYWENTGLTTNMSLLSVKDGVLKIDNKTNNPNGAYATFNLTPDPELAVVSAGKDYTIQYDITYEDASDYMWAGFGLLRTDRTFVGGSRANLNGAFARLYQRGRVELLTQYGHTYRTIANDTSNTLNGTVVEAATLCATIFGEGANTMESKTVTVRIVYKNVAEETEGALAAGIYVYVKEKGSAEFTLASSIKRSLDTYNEKDTNTSETYTSAKIEFVLGGSYDNDQGTAKSIKGDLAFRQNTTNVPGTPFVVDGTEYEGYYTPENDASGIIYLDNIAIWEGTGNIPANKTPVAPAPGTPAA